MKIKAQVVSIDGDFITLVADEIVDVRQVKAGDVMFVEHADAAPTVTAAAVARSNLEAFDFQTGRLRSGGVLGFSAVRNLCVEAYNCGLIEAAATGWMQYAGLDSVPLAVEALRQHIKAPLYPIDPQARAEQLKADRCAAILRETGIKLLPTMTKTEALAACVEYATLHGDRRIMAIKAYRAYTGTSIRDAHDSIVYGRER